MERHENIEVAEFYTQRIMDFMTGKRTMPSVSLAHRPEGIHASDLDDNNCPLTSFYSRTLESPPPITRDEALKFFRGRTVERVIAQEAEPREVNGIWMTVDDVSDEYGLAEIKSTATSNVGFLPDVDFPQWVTRMKSYCYGYEKKQIHLVVYFLVGNMPSYTVWNIKDLPKGTSYCGVDLRVWTYEFTDSELRAWWLLAEERAEELSGAILTHSPPSPDSVRERLPFRLNKKGEKVFWQCRYCRYSPYCYYHEQFTLNNGNGRG